MLKKVYFAGGLICAVLCVLCLARLIWGFLPRSDWSEAYGSGLATPEAIQTPLSTPQSQSPENTPAAQPSTEPYVSPIDFAALQAVNDEIYAWLDIPGSDISYPVVQSATDDTYYLDHASDGSKNSDGALFTEHAYNGTAFDDIVTVVYGHHMRSGSMFGSLQTLYSDEESYREHSEIVVYLPYGERHYQVFAAVPYDKRHILYNYDFSNARLYQAYFESIVSIRSLNANLSPENTPLFDTHVLILSTCLQGNSDGRYLVMAKQVE